MSFQWLTGEDKGRYRETRASRFDPNMGWCGPPVKSTDFKQARAKYDFLFI
jgi:hypothetical protein